MRFMEQVNTPRGRGYVVARTAEGEVLVTEPLEKGSLCKIYGWCAEHQECIERGGVCPKCKQSIKQG